MECHNAQLTTHNFSTMLAVIFNPAAGRGRISQGQLEARLARHAAGAPFRVWPTDCAGDAARLARRAGDEGASVVAAAGGDGTLGEVADVVRQSGAALGVLPLGTGNDFARALGIGTDLDGAIAALFRGQRRWVDGGRAHLEGNSYFWLNVAGCGFDALVAKRINAARFHPFWRHWKGTAAYGAAVALELRTLNAAHLTLTLDGQTVERRALLCAVANANSYGGGMRVAPDASLDDGLFDVCLIKEAGSAGVRARVPLGLCRTPHRSSQSRDVSGGARHSRKRTGAAGFGGRRSARANAGHAANRAARLGSNGAGRAPQLKHMAWN